MKNWSLAMGCFFLALLFFLGIFAPQIAPFNPTEISLSQELQKPNGIHLLGNDSNGTDILSILIFGARLSLEVGILVTLLSLAIGLAVGSLAGYWGGWVDSLLMRSLEIVFAFPGILLAIALASMLGPSKSNIILCLVVTGWAGYARLVRAEIMNLKTKEYIESARALGLNTPRILLFHLWPNIVSPLLVASTFGLAGTVLAEASLSFLGIGMPPGTPSWGSLLNSGRDVLLEAPHVAAFPGMAIAFTVFTFHLLGEGLRRKLDAKADL